MPWSCLMRQAFSFLSFEGFSISSVFGSSCGLALTWQGKLVLMIMSPLVLIMIGFFVVMAKRAAWKSKFSLLEELAQMTQVVVVLTHSSITNMAMVFFAKEDIDGEEHIRANITMPFDDAKHQGVLGYAIFGLTYAALVPVIFSAALVGVHYVSPGTLLDKDGPLYRSLGSLYGKQKPFARSLLAPLWEAVRLVRKMVLTTIVVFETGSQRQASLALGLLLISVAVLAFSKPVSGLACTEWPSLIFLFLCLPPTVLQRLERSDWQGHVRDESRRALLIDHYFPNNMPGRLLQC
jgi:hypothetical protein